MYVGAFDGDAKGVSSGTAVPGAAERRLRLPIGRSGRGDLLAQREAERLSFENGIVTKAHRAV